MPLRQKRQQPITAEYAFYWWINRIQANRGNQSDSVDCEMRYFTTSSTMPPRNSAHKINHQLTTSTDVPHDETTITLLSGTIGPSSNPIPNSEGWHVYGADSITASGASAANGRRRKRRPFSAEQIEILEAKFQEKRHLGCKEREELGAQTGLDESQVKVWFQNRRTKERKQGERERSNNNNGSETGVMDLNQDARSCSPMFTNPPPLRIGTSPQGVHHTDPPPLCPTYQNSPFQLMPTNDYAPTSMYCSTMPSHQQPSHFQYNAINTTYLSLNGSPGGNKAPREISPDSDRSHAGLPPPSMNGMGRIPDVISRQLVSTNDIEDLNQRDFNLLLQLPPLPQPPVNAHSSVYSDACPTTPPYFPNDPTVCTNSFPTENYYTNLLHYSQV
nr:homeobox protein DLX 3 [Hymenolepis microstoma]